MKRNTQNNGQLPIIDWQFNRIAVKIGSNVLTRKDGTLDITRMSALVDQVAKLHRKGVEVVLISSGAVASGRSEIKASKKLDPVSARQLYSAVGQAKLINRYYELFREHGMTCGQVLTTKENFGSRTHYLNQKHCMEVMLENKVIPIVNENDTISVTELMFTDNDDLLVCTYSDRSSLLPSISRITVEDGSDGLPLYIPSILLRIIKASIPIMVAISPESSSLSVNINSVTDIVSF